MGSEDTFGRAMWGLGAAVNLFPKHSLSVLASEMFEKGLEVADKLSFLRAISYTMIGIYELSLSKERTLSKNEIMKRLAEKIIAAYRENADEDWRWPEDEVTYDNARLPQALMLAYKMTGNREYLDVALRLLDFLTETQYKDG